VSYHDAGGMRINLEQGFCSFTFHTVRLSDQQPGLEPIDSGTQRRDRHEIRMHLTSAESQSVSDWLGRHRLLEPATAGLAEKEPSTDSSGDRTVITLAVAIGDEARHFRLDRDMDVSEPLRSAEADLLMLCWRFQSARRDLPLISPYASILTEAGAETCLKAAPPDPSGWKEPRLFHQPFDHNFAERIVISKSDFPAALLAPVHSPNKAYYYMAVKPDFAREGPWNTAVYVYAELDQLTRIDLLDHSAFQPSIEWVNEKLLFIRVWWGRQVGTDLVIDVEAGKPLSMEMVEDGRLLFEQHAESSKALGQDEADPGQSLSIAELRQKLQTGTPREKEAALDSFTARFQVELVPDVVAAILDETRLPRHGDTGWGTVHHYAATAMCNFARRIDGLSQKERGRHDYSFYDEGGVAGPERRQEVHDNWLAWWGENEPVPVAVAR
jgi:hypothetical protein